MAEVRALGKLINERRLARNFSAGQLATKVDVTPAEVRKWEKGETVPDPAVLDDLAAALEMDSAELRAAAAAARPKPTGSAPPVPPGSRSGAAPQPTSVVPEGEPKRTDPRAAGPPPAANRRSPGAAGQPRPEAPTAAFAAPVFSSSDDTSSAADDGTSPGATRRDEAVAPRGEATAPASAQAQDDTPVPSSERARLVDLPTEAVPVVPAPEPRAAVATVAAPGPSIPAAEPATGPFAWWDRWLRLLYDPNKRYLFWLRTVLTIIVMLVFLRVLAWAVPAFFDTLKDILDTIESTTTDTTLPFG